MTPTDPSSPPAAASRPSPEKWDLPTPYTRRFWIIMACCMALFLWSGKNVEMDRFLEQSGQALAYSVGLAPESEVAEGFSSLLQAMFPPALSLETPVGEALPEGMPQPRWPARLEVRRQFDVAIDIDTLQQDIRVEEEWVLVEPFGYLWLVLKKMAQTLEIGLWGTFVAIVISLPLACFSARNYAPNRAVYFAARAMVSFFRTIPELISALLLVLAFGFGPVAGVLALGLHCTGFLGKFYAEDIENCDRGPQEALHSLGAGRWRVLRMAVLPQVLPQYVAYTLYILDRNVRMAAVIGIVGAGGIGQELKGRYDLFQYSHVATILIVLFITVLVLDHLSARVRARIIR